MTKRHLLPIAATLALVSRTGFAQDGRIDAADTGDTAWLLISAALVLLMALPGLSLFYAGQVRSKNCLSVLTQCGAIAATVSLSWIVAGYTVAFGGGTNGWIGSGSAWMLITLGNVREGTAIPESAFVLLQMGFAIIAAAFMAGAWAGRARFGWVVAFTALWSLVIYAPVAHWIWGGGWLDAGVGALDWSGGIVVHTTAGISALVVAVLLGRRKPLGQIAGDTAAPALTLAGAALLWIGWLGVAGGSALTASDDAAAAIIAAHAAAASAAMVRLLIERIMHGKPTASGFATGAIAGLVTISPAAGYVSPGAAIVFGALGSIACYLAARFVRDTLRIDDAMSVFATHGVGGMLGSVLLGVFLSEQLGGVGYDDGMNMVAQTVAQLVAIGIVAIWSIVATVIMALMASVAFPMRVSESTELAGLDLASHGQNAWGADRP